MPETTAPEPIAPSSARKKPHLLLWSGVLLCVVLRVIALSSDAYPRLSWSSGLLTDEGYYLHNARNLVLFGDAHQDEWNNSLIMPTLHAVQVGVFRTFGVGIVQARLISVVFSLVLLALMVLAVRKWKPGSDFVTLIALLFLGLDHASLLYHRLALMDTPGAALLVGAWCCFVYSLRSREKAIGWAFCCGLMLVLAYTVRGLAALVFVCPIVALLSSIKENKRQFVGIVCGLAVGMGCYLVLWYVPHREELAHYNSYYLHAQLMPHSWAQFVGNVRVSLFSWSRGLLPYLIKHTGIVFGLAVWQCVLFVRANEQRKDPIAAFLVWWFVLFVALFCVVNYAPSRYYVLFYPAMAILAARRLAGMREQEQSPPCPGTKTYPAQKQASYGRAIWKVCVLIWALINGYWLVDWIGHIQYRQVEAGRELARMLPPESWVFGSVAPGLCTNNRLHPVNVIPGLCNGENAIEERAGKPRFVVILDGKWRQDYWNVHYGAIVTESHKIDTFRGLLRPFFEIGVYKVPDDFGSP